MMKRSCLVSMGIFISAAGYAQGTAQGTIGYQNNTTSLVQIFNPGSFTPVPAPVNGGVEVELFYQFDAGGPTPAPIFSTQLGNWTATSVVSVSPIAALAGIFTSPNLTLFGIPAGANAWIEIVGWNQSALSLTAALNNGSTSFGAAPVFSITTGNFANGNLPPSTPPNINGPGLFQGLTLLPPIPEPSTLALGALGALALVYLRTRKRA